MSQADRQPRRQQIEDQVAAQRGEHQPSRRCRAKVQHVAQQEQYRQIRTAENQCLAEIAGGIGQHAAIVPCPDHLDRP